MRNQNVNHPCYLIKSNLDESSRHTASLKQRCIPRKKPDGTIKSSWHEQKMWLKKTNPNCLILSVICTKYVYNFYQKVKLTRCKEEVVNLS